MTQKNIRIGLFGFGCVGKGLFDVLQATSGIKAEIVKIAVKNKEKIRSIPSDYFVYDENEILEDPYINTVVELIDDHNAAYRIGKQALLRGKNLISANKRMLAYHLRELSTIADEQNVALLYEGAACGSIPIIRNLEEYYDNDLLNSLSGIFNGSSNYILSKMCDERMDYFSALNLAQTKGFAESDPTLDVNGFDALFKTVILIAHSFGVFIHPNDILRLGIQHLDQSDLAFAGRYRYKIKPVCIIKKVDHLNFTAYVMPSFVKFGDHLYHVDNEYNAVSVEAAFSDRQLLIGKGAGGHPTGSAVLSDISACSYSYRYEYKKRAQGLTPTFSNHEDIHIYVRGSGKITSNLTSNLRSIKQIETESGTAITGWINSGILKKHATEWESERLFIASMPL